MPAGPAVQGEMVRTVDEGPAGETQARGGWELERPRTGCNETVSQFEGESVREGLTRQVEVPD